MPLSNGMIGKRISTARKAMGLTQLELSEMIGISEKHLSRIECGKQLPSIVIVARICESLCVSADKLLLINQSTALNNSIHNEIAEFSICEQKRIIDNLQIKGTYDYGCAFYHCLLFLESLTDERERKKTDRFDMHLQKYLTFEVHTNRSACYVILCYGFYHSHTSLLLSLRIFSGSYTVILVVIISLDARRITSASTLT